MFAHDFPHWRQANLISRVASWVVIMHLPAAWYACKHTTLQAVLYLPDVLCWYR